MEGFLMADERMTETTDANGNVVERVIERNATPTPVTVNTTPSGGTGMGGIFMVLLLALVAIGGFFLYANNSSKARKDDAVAKAADSVEKAADKAGNAVEKAGAAAEKAVDKIAN
jgi:hypothetical protein